MRPLGGRAPAVSLEGGGASEQPRLHHRAPPGICIGTHRLLERWAGCSLRRLPQTSLTRVPRIPMRPLLGVQPALESEAAVQQPDDYPTTFAATKSPSRPLPPGTVARLACIFEGQPQQQAAGPSPSSAWAAAAARSKRQRTAGGPPLPDEWLQSPPLANGGNGTQAAEGEEPVERALFAEGSGEAALAGGGCRQGDAAAREARLAAIRAK